MNCFTLFRTKNTYKGKGKGKGKGKESLPLFLPGKEIGNKSALVGSNIRKIDLATQSVLEKGQA